MAFEHGVRVQEQATSLTVPIEGTAGLQVIFGTAPVNLAADPYAATNTPIITYSWDEAVKKIGYSAELDENGHFKYTLCGPEYINYKLVGVAPVIFVNVLDPKTHRKTNDIVSVPVIRNQATIPTTGVLLDTITVQRGNATEGDVMDEKTLAPCDRKGAFEGVNYSDMMGKDTRILSDGSVVGVLPYIKGYTGFGSGNKKNQEGNYFPLHIGIKGAKKLKKTAPAEEAENHKEVTLDDSKDIIIHISGNDAAYNILGDDDNVLASINFKNVTLLKEGQKIDLEKDVDYTLSFNDDGLALVTLIGEEEDLPDAIAVESESIDPEKVEASDIIGASSGGGEKGLEVLRQVYPKFGMTPGIISAPGWSQDPDVGMALQAKCEEINGYFRCECFIDLDSGPTGCTEYTNVKEQKEKSGCNSPHAMALWPCVASGSMKFWYSAFISAEMAYIDASNDDVPYLSPSNKAISVTETVLADAKQVTADDGSVIWDKPVILDQLQANLVNSFGVTTAINMNGWKTWGNRTAAYPSSTDPKDMWFCVRRFFSWWDNTFILTYVQKVDDPLNRHLVNDIIDSENLRGQALVAADKCAGAWIEKDVQNTPQTLMNGQIIFHTHLTPWPPAEDILNIIEFDPYALQEALGGE